MNKYLIIIIAAAASLLIVAAIIIFKSRPLPKRARSIIKHRKYMSRDSFLRSWNEDKTDYPGCYVVLIYDKKLIFNPMNYDDIYVGQSVNVRKRVFSHLKGRGNGDVYYGVKSGCKVYVIIMKCPAKKLNRNEKELIEFFDATRSLNLTRGGAAKR